MKKPKRKRKISWRRVLFVLVALMLLGAYARGTEIEKERADLADPSKNPVLAIAGSPFVKYEEDKGWHPIRNTITGLKDAFGIHSSFEEKQDNFNSTIDSITHGN